MTAGPIPVPTPTTLPFWEGTAQGELRIQQCDSCERFYFYPRPICRYCGSDQVTWQTVSGKATLASYVINYRPAPFFETKDPQIIALVDLAEGVRMATNLVDIAPDPELLKLGMPLTVKFEERGDQFLPVFAPVEGGTR
jgi:hypothetical protein